MASVYVPPAASSGNSCSGGCGTTDDAKYNYLSGYFNAHMLSMSSHRYTYITWIVIALVALILSALYHFGMTDSSYIGALWNRWAIRNRVIKVGKKPDLSHNGASARAPKRRKIITLPSFGRILLLIALIVIPVILTIIGADYIRPTANVFNMKESWPSSNISPFTAGLNRRLLWGQGTFPRVTTNPPTITLPYRTWWTAGGRTGAMTNGLTPLIVVIALKQIPFALLSTKFMGGIAFDRLSLLHKWGGRVVWLFATAHIILWSIQLSEDQAFNGSMWVFVFMWTRFRWGWVSYGFFTLLILLSLGPIRANYYEFFYVAHVVCIIGFMISAWLHHPPLGAWMYVTLLWWLAERITRTIKVAYINGIGFAGRRQAAKGMLQDGNGQNNRVTGFGVNGGVHHSSNISFSVASSHTLHGDQSHFMKLHASSGPQALGGGGAPNGTGWQADRRKTRISAMYDPVSDVIEDYAGSTKGENDEIQMQPIHSQRGIALHDDGPVTGSVSSFHVPRMPDARPDSPQSSSFHASADQYARSHDAMHRSNEYPERQLNIRRSAMAADVAAVLKPGFAYVQLLPGKTLRLTLRTPNAFSWQPGQYVNLTVPKVRWWQSHPFTIASAHSAGYSSARGTLNDDAEKGLIAGSAASGKDGEERTVVLLLRARAGFTHALWDYVRVERERQIRQIEQTTGMQYAHGQVAKTATGVHVRAIIDGPFGSAQRTRWTIHSTVVIICGGSGISYGMSVLEHLCAVMSGIRRERNPQTRRIRFVWILREYSHLQWVASSLRRCVEMVPPEMLQVELFVTSAQARKRANAQRPGLQFSSQDLTNNATHGSNGMYGASYDENLSLHQPRFTDGPEQDEYGVDAYDLTQFEGEDFSAPTAAEAKISERVHKEGRLRRAHTRRATLKRNKQRAAVAAAIPTAKASQPRQSQFNPNSEEAVMRAAQNRIHQGGNEKIWQPQAQHPSPFASKHANEAQPTNDLGDMATSVEVENKWRDDDTNDQSYRGLQVNVQGASPLLEHSDNEGYFSTTGNPANRFPNSPLPFSPSPSATPAFSPAPSSAGRRTPEPFATESLHSLHPSMANSTTNLNMSYNQPHGHDRMYDQHRRTPLSNGHNAEAYRGGDDLQPTQSVTDAPIDLDERENADLSVMAELARLGYPKLDRIVREEVQQSAGKILVAACGPGSLGTLVRSIVCKQIDLKAVRAGLPNSHINIATESYEWGE